MNSDELKYILMIKQFNSELIELNIKYSEELEVLRKQKKDSIEFIDRYLSLNLDNFNASSLIKKLREILKRGDKEWIFGNIK